MGLFDNIFGKKKKAPADFSNVRSGSSTSAAPPGTSPSVTRTGGPETGAPHRVYVVVSGDSLSKIAKREYGDAKKWPKIFDANRDLIKDPDLIHPGQKLTIPPA